MKKREIIVNRIDSEEQMTEVRRRAGGRGNGRRKSARGGKKLTPKQKRTLAIVITVSAVIIIGLVAWGVSRFLGSGLSNSEGEVLVDDIVEDKVSVLLVGSDGGGYNTDTMMLAMMDCKNHTVNLMSIPRDTRVPNPYGGSGHAKINSVYAAKGMDGLIEQIGIVTGLPINYYVKIDFEGFKKAIDILGGVQFDVPMRLKYDDAAQNLHIDLQAGPQLLDGDHAEQLVRARSQYPMADITRTEVQRNFIKETIKQHATPANLLKVGDLYNTLVQYVTTNITLGDALKYATVLTQVPEENIQMYILPGTTNGSGDWLYDAAEMEKLANEVFWYNVTVRPTPRPTTRPKNNTNNNTSTPKPAVTHTPTPDDEKPQQTVTPKPTQAPTQAPTQTPNKTASPTKAPEKTAEPTPKATQTPVPTKAPQTSTAPGDYPDGV